MTKELARELAAATEKLTAPVVTELTADEVAAVAGGLYAEDLLDDGSK